MLPVVRVGRTPCGSYALYPQRLKMIMKKQKQQARQEKRVEYTVEVNIEESKQTLVGLVIEERMTRDVRFSCNAVAHSANHRAC